MPRLPRRGLIAGVGLAAAMSAPARAAAIKGQEYWAQKGEVKLFVWRKRIDDASARPVLFLVHGSSFSGSGGFDLQVPGHPGYSMMDEFAAAGFDVWTVDHENYGRSTRTGTTSDIRSGVEDLKATLPLVEKVTGVGRVMLYGQSSGALRAGVLAMEAPERVDRLVLDAFTWTGEGAPEIMRRRREVASYQAQPWRAATAETFRGIFSRDDPSTFEPAVAKALAEYELKLGDRIPNGTYVDMAIHLPLVDPARVACPVLLVRAAADGNATEAELFEFFSKLPNKDRQFAMIAGVAHVAVLGINRRRVWHVMREFLTYPPVQAG